MNLRHGIKGKLSRTGVEKDTCTACAGTMILEFSALSRLTGNKIYEVGCVEVFRWFVGGEFVVVFGDGQVFLRSFFGNFSGIW